MSQVHRHASRWIEPQAVPAGHARPRRRGRRSRRAWPRRRWPASSTDKLVDLTYPARSATRASAIVTDKSPEALHALPAQHGAPAGGGGDAALSRARSAASARPPTKASSTTSSSSGRSCPRTSRRIENEDAGAGGAGPASTSGRCGRARRRSRSSRERGEPLKVQLIEEKTAGQPEVSCYTIKDKDTFVDFCVGPHVPSTGRLKAFKLLTHVERLLEGRRAEPADAARLRHGVLHARRS